MRLLAFGASGPLGRAITDAALAAGADPADLTAQHRVLVLEHEEFGILGRLAPGQRHQTAVQAAYEQVEDRKAHSGMISAHTRARTRPGEIE